MHALNKYKLNLFKNNIYIISVINISLYYSHSQRPNSIVNSYYLKKGYKELLKKSPKLLYATNEV